MNKKSKSARGRLKNARSRSMGTAVQASRRRSRPKLPQSVRVGASRVGKGVFARRAYGATAIVGEITGTFIEDPEYNSAYCIEIDSRTSLEPAAPFRFLNHSCDPNCEFDFEEQEEAAAPDQGPFVSLDSAAGLNRLPEVFLYAIRDIEAGEELTIDYNWPASHAIPCVCGASTCRGWVVSEEELKHCKMR